MRSLLVGAIVVAVSTTAQAASIEGPLEPAAHGKVQCFAPNQARKTCFAMSSYRIGSDGTLEVITTMVVGASEPEIIMETTSSVEIKDSRVCGIFRVRDIAEANFTLNGKPAGDQQTYLLRDKIEEATLKYADREACTTYQSDGAALKAKSSWDGVEQPKLNQVVMWVSPDDGYKVGQSR
jgi:hypothetical protein